MAGRSKTNFFILNAKDLCSPQGSNQTNEEKCSWIERAFMSR